LVSEFSHGTETKQHAINCRNPVLRVVSDFQTPFSLMWIETTDSLHNNTAVGLVAVVVKRTLWLVVLFVKEHDWSSHW